MNPQITEPLSQLAGSLKRNMLRWHVGQVIFCPSCQAVLDYRRAVEIDVSQEGQLVKSLVVCAPFFDSKVKENAKAMLEQLGAHSLTVEIPDGRRV